MKNFIIFKLIAPFLRWAVSSHYQFLLLYGKIVDVKEIKGKCFIDFDGDLISFEYTQGAIFCVNGYYFSLIHEGFIEEKSMNKSKPNFKKGDIVYIYHVHQKGKKFTSKYE